MRNIIVGIVMFVTGLLCAQTGINTGDVSQHAALQIDVSEHGKGVLIPNMTTTERDKNFAANQLVNGFVIYNTDEKCFNYWNFDEQEWKNLCGSVGKAVFSLENCNTLAAEGVYVAEQLTQENNVITVTVDVKKPGTYTLIAVSREDNGYYFSAGGEFSTVGKTTVKLYAQGRPRMPRDDIFDVLKNSGAKTPGCSFTINVEDPSIAPLFTLDCKSVKFKGLYQLGAVLTTTHTLEMEINVTGGFSGASYEVQTNEVDGVSFRGSGKLRASEGKQKIILQGYGVPLTNLDKQFQIRSNSQDPLVKTCGVELRFSSPSRKMIVYGGNANKNWSILNTNSGIRKMLNNTDLFGENDTSVVQFDGWESIDGGTAIPVKTTADTSPNYVKTRIPYDIVVLENGITSISNEQSELLINYMQQGGVVIMLVDEPELIKDFVSFITSLHHVKAVRYGANKSAYRFANVNTRLLNGPFGDVRGKYWGGNYMATILEDLTVGAFDALSEATDHSQPAIALPEPPNSGEDNDDDQPSDGDEAPEVESHGKEGVNILALQGYNFLWVGAGEFNNYENGSAFALDSANAPIPVENYGHTRKQTVYNAVFMANVFGWAIRSSSILK